MLKIKSLCVFKLALTILVIFNAAGQTVVEIKGNQFYINGDNTIIESGNVLANILTLKLKKSILANKITYLDSKNWNQNNILWGENGIAALTFYEVPVMKID